MKTTAICYYSQHHGNTKKLLDAIRKSDPEVILIDVTNDVMKDGPVDLEEYDRIGFASGIYYSRRRRRRRREFSGPMAAAAMIPSDRLNWWEA